MEIHTFDSPEAMQNALAEMREKAKAGLHAEQDRITFDDCWVEFLDIGARLIIFGRVHTLDEVRKGEEEEDVDEIVEMTTRDLESGLMYGVAYSIHEPTGELGYTHKANVWPIERRLLDMAREAEWRVDDLDETGRLLLEIAYSAYRAHRIEGHKS